MIIITLFSLYKMSIILHFFMFKNTKRQAMCGSMKDADLYDMISLRGKEVGQACYLPFHCGQRRNKISFLVRGFYYYYFFNVFGFKEEIRLCNLNSV